MEESFRSLHGNEQLNQLKSIILAAMGIIGLGCLINLRDYSPDIGVSALMFLGIYFFGLEKLKVRDYKTVQRALLILEAITIIFFLKSLSIPLAMMLNGILAIILYMGVEKTRKIITINK